ncbi:hypothetical protein JC862_14510 [Morganella morganii]|nr:hypothetical protein [Morganella morganii]QXO45543.1 hypothetical protein JC862_14510 [Morganella morganii]
MYFSYAKKQKTKNKKIHKKNQSAKSSALWQGGKGRIPGNIHQYVTRNSECSQHSHRAEDDADSINHPVCGIRQGKNSGEHTSVSDPEF